MSAKLTGTLTALVIVGVLGAIGLAAQDSRPVPADRPFGGPADVAFGKKLWTSVAGYETWKLHTDVYRGQSPHGKFVRLYSTWVTVDGRSHPLIIKDNYAGRGVSAEAVGADRTKWLRSVTIMLQREEGYDPDHDDWYWAKYAPDGSIETNPAGVKLVGRVAKGTTRGCISCHDLADGEDYLFSNDE